MLMDTTNVTTIADNCRFIENVMQQRGLNRETYDEMWSSQINI